MEFSVSATQRSEGDARISFWAIFPAQFRFLGGEWRRPQRAGRRREGGLCAGPQRRLKGLFVRPRGAQQA